MNHLQDFIAQTDAVGLVVAGLLLIMSISAWVLIVWKSLVLRRALHDTESGMEAFWEAANLDDARRRLETLDRERLLLPLVDAAVRESSGQRLAVQARAESQLTRHLRDALHTGLAHLQTGQVVLASIGSTAPFVGLFGTVWGIYHALLAIGGEGNFSIDKVAGPVGEALVMTAAGLAVAIPAVLAYNLFGRWVGQCETALEGFAHDLREWRLDSTGQGRQARSEH